MVSPNGSHPETERLPTKDCQPFSIEQALCRRNILQWISIPSGETRTRRILENRNGWLERLSLCSPPIFWQAPDDDHHPFRQTAIHSCTTRLAIIWGRVQPPFWWDHCQLPAQGAMLWWPCNHHDTIHWDVERLNNWWRTIDYLILVGRAGVFLEPLPIYLDAIQDFPKPKSTTGVRSWFGLVNQVTNSAQLRAIMRPFNPLLTPKIPFRWSVVLANAFQASKSSIIEAIGHGVDIIDLRRRTCLRPDWSKNGIGYFLSQKHCDCATTLPGCCDDGWKITLSGSRFLIPTAMRQ